MIKTSLILSAILLSASLVQAGTCRIRTAVKVERANNPLYWYCQSDLADPFTDEFYTSRTYKRSAETKEECSDLAQNMLGEEVVVGFLEGIPAGMILVAPMEPRVHECHGTIDEITKIKFK